METKHTPGPWEVSGSHIVATSTRVQIANVYSPKAYDPKQAQESANARLIAAAPELLTELEQSTWRLRNALVWMPADCTERSEIEKQIDANQTVIAKARNK